MSKWSHLANAKHIDRIIADAKANPTAYDAAAWDAARDAAYNAAWDAARVAARDAAAWDAAYNAAIGAPAWFAVWDPARVAILALVAWDHAGGLMYLPAEQVKVLSLLGDRAAILLYPAIAVMETTQELA